MVAVGITLQPEDAFLGRLDRVLREEADYFEVAPETLWAVDDDDRFRPNRYRGAFLALAEKARRPFVAHGVALSLGSASPDDVPRRHRWLRRVAIDHRRFGFLWYSDHLGPTTVAGEAVTSPMPLPMTATSAAVVRAQLAAMQRVVPDVGFENSVTYFLFGRLADEPAFFERILGPPGMHLVLDLHNVYTMARNLGGDPGAYLAAIDLRHVIEIHLAGGNRSQPGWLPGGRTVRLDSHDSAVPEEVWRLFAAVAPRCPGLRGVTLERMEGTVRADDVPLIREELRRARRMIAGKRGAPIVVAAPPLRSPARRAPARLPRAGLAAHLATERLLAAAMRAPDPVARLTSRLARASDRHFVSTAERDGILTYALLVATLRFQRLVRWSLKTKGWFLSDTAAFVAAFRRYHRAVPMTAHFPRQEARLFRAWLARAAAPPARSAASGATSGVRASTRVRRRRRPQNH
jgi:uncharacterized protein (UPF0276 family)